MTSQDAKKILMLYRPGTADRDDPAFAEALAMAQPQGLGAHDHPNPELAHWFAEHCADYAIIRRAFAKIEVPPGLHGQILGERKIRPRAFSSRRVFVAACAFAAVVAVVGLLRFTSFPTGSADSFTAYRARMVRTALRLYGMDLETPDLKAVQTFLRGKAAPADYTLPPALQSAQTVGCAALTWQGKPVSMICFRTGRPLPSGAKADLWLFVVNQDSVHPPSSEAMLQAVKVNKLTTRVWQQGDNVYLLAVEGSPGYLQTYLN